MKEIDNQIKQTAILQVEKMEKQDRYKSRVNWKLAENTRLYNNPYKLTQEEEEKKLAQKALKQLKQKANKISKQMINEDNELSSDGKNKKEVEKLNFLDQENFDQDSNVIYNFDPNIPSITLSRKQNYETQFQNQPNKKQNFDDLNTSCSSDDYDENSNTKGLQIEGIRKGPSSLYPSYVPINKNDLKEEFENFIIKMQNTPEIFDTFVRFFWRVQNCDQNGAFNEKIKEEIQKQISSTLKLNNTQIKQLSSQQNEKDIINLKKNISPVSEITSTKIKIINHESIFNKQVGKQDENLTLTSNQIQTNLIKKEVQSTSSLQLDPQSKDSIIEVSTQLNSISNTVSVNPPVQNKQVDSYLNQDIKIINTSNNIFNTLNQKNQKQSIFQQNQNNLKNSLSQSEIVQTDASKKPTEIAINIISNHELIEVKQSPQKALQNIFQSNEQIQNSISNDNISQNDEIKSTKISSLNQIETKPQPLNIFQNTNVNNLSVLKNIPEKKINNNLQNDKIESDKQNSNKHNDDEQIQSQNEVLKQNLNLSGSGSLKQKAVLAIEQDQKEQNNTNQTPKILINIESQDTQSKSSEKNSPKKIINTYQNEQLTNLSQIDESLSQQAQDSRLEQNKNAYPQLNIFSNNNNENGVKSKTSIKNSPVKAINSKQKEQPSNLIQNDESIPQSAQESIQEKNKTTISINLISNNNNNNDVNIFAPKVEDNKQIPEKENDKNKNDEQNEQTNNIQQEVKKYNIWNESSSTTSSQNELEIKKLSKQKQPVNIQETLENEDQQITVKDKSSNINQPPNNQNQPTNNVNQPKTIVFLPTSENPFTLKNPFQTTNLNNNETSKPFNLQSLISQNSNMFSNVPNIQTQSQNIDNNLFNKDNNIFQQNSTLKPSDNNTMEQQNTSNQIGHNNINRCYPINIFQNQDNNIFGNTNNAMEIQINTLSNNDISQDGIQNGLFQKNKNNIFNTGINNTFSHANTQYQPSQNNQQFYNNLFPNQYPNNINNDSYNSLSNPQTFQNQTMLLENNSNNQRQEYIPNNNLWNKTQNTQYDINSMGIENPMDLSGDRILNNNNNNNIMGDGSNQPHFFTGSNYNPTNQKNNIFHESLNTNFFEGNKGASDLFLKPQTISNNQPPIVNNNIPNQNQTQNQKGPSSSLFDNTQNKTKNNKKNDQSNKVSKLLGTSNNQARIH